jgi:hypothetical protein
MPAATFRTALLAALLFPAAAAGAEGPVVCFYGPPPLEKLATHATVVLIPGRVTRADVSFLQSRGCRVLGYLSLGEDDRLRRGDGRGPGGYASWYLDEHAGDGLSTPGSDGKPDSNAGWGSYYVDPSDRAWRKTIRDEVKRIREDLGMDGLFADTVLVPRDMFTRRREDGMARGMMALLGSLKSWSSGGFVLVNNGQALASRLGRRIDGVMIETESDGGEESWNDVRVTAAELDPLRRSRPFLISALVYLSGGASATEACRVLGSLGLPATLYRDDAAGRALTALPIQTCP